MKDIAGYGGNYAATTDGQIWSHHSKRCLKLRIGRCGYLEAELYCPSKRRTVQRAVHRLIAEAYLSKVAGFDVNHINGIKTDNRPDNLEYKSRGANIAHAVRLGLMPQGEKHWRHRLTESVVREIRRRHSDHQFESYRKLAAEFNIDVGHLCLIITRKAWKHI